MSLTRINQQNIIHGPFWYSVFAIILSAYNPPVSHPLPINFSISNRLASQIMITKYFTKVSVKFDPFAASAKPARLFLSRIPTSLRATCAVDFKVLTSTSPASEKPIVKVTFKDKHSMEADPQAMTFKEISEHFDSHSRKLVMQDSITE
ncbi:39S ribosomal protein L44, mitochondrial [Meyerozyma guilliermondii]